MDREEEYLCCHEIQQVANKSEEVFEHVKPSVPYNCITDNPGFHTVCLDRWVLQAAWFQYRQQYGIKHMKVLNTKTIGMPHTGS